MAVFRRKLKNNDRFRSFCAVLYPENESHNQIIERIEDECDQYLYILHNEDEIESEEKLGITQLKKAHIHILFRFRNARYVSSVKEKLGFLDDNEHFLCKCSNYIGYMFYMIHHGYNEKHQYSADSLVGSKELVFELKKKMNTIDKVEELIIKEILDYIDHSRHCTINNVARFCQENGYWQEYRKSQFIIRDYIKEHNFLMSDETGLIKEALIIKEFLEKNNLRLEYDGE